MKKGTQMSKQQIQQRYKQTLANQAEKLLNQQVSQSHPNDLKVEMLSDKMK